MSRVFFVGCFLCFFCPSLVLASGPRAYLLTPKIFSPLKLSVDGQVHKLMGFPSGAMVQSFSADSKAMKFAQAYRSNMIWSTSIGLVSTLGYGAYLFYPIFNDQPLTLDRLTDGLLIFSFGMVVSGIFRFLAGKRLIQAVNQINGVGGQVSVRLSPGLELAPAQKGLGLALRF